MASLSLVSDHMSKDNLYEHQGNMFGSMITKTRVKGKGAKHLWLLVRIFVDARIPERISDIIHGHLSQPPPSPPAVHFDHGGSDH